jgi:thiamine biosynthesis lipoprotein
MINRLEFKAMGCHNMLAVLDSPDPLACAYLQQVPKWFEEWEQSLSRFRETSELNTLNNSAGAPFRVSETIWQVFKTSIDAEKMSLGLVTPAILEALLAAGYDRSFDQMMPELPRLSLNRTTFSGSLEDIFLDETDRTICLPFDLKLDFGGVAKGWAADQASRRLAGLGPVLINAGGDISISAAQSNGQAWPIGVTDPFNPGGNLETLLVGRGGIATSGKDYRRWQRGGVWQHHIIDPRTGSPAESDVLAATVIAPTAVEAEVAAKVVLISGSQVGLDWLESEPELAGIFILEDGQCIYSQRIENYLWRSL